MTYKDAKHITHNASATRLENIIASLQLIAWQDEAETRRAMKAARLVKIEKRREMQRRSLRHHTLGYGGRALAK